MENECNYAASILSNLKWVEMSEEQENCWFFSSLSSIIQINPANLCLYYSIQIHQFKILQNSHCINKINNQKRALNNAYHIHNRISKAIQFHLTNWQIIPFLVPFTLIEHQHFGVFVVNAVSEQQIAQISSILRKRAMFIWYGFICN